MAGTTPRYGIPYPQASDLVANYPALGEDLAEIVDEKLPRYQSAAPTSPSVGQVWIDSDDNLGRVWTGSVWQLFSGPGNANFSDAATGTFSSGGVNYKFRTYNASGTITVTQAGNADLFVLAGGGGAAGSGGGAGGLLLLTVPLTVQTYTITVGAGGTTAPTNGVNSFIRGAGLNVSFNALGGGWGPVAWGAGNSGGCGGGGNGAGLALAGQGNDGANAAPGTYAGGGGQGAAGSGGSGGAGIQSLFTGTSVNRAAGGRGSGSNGTFWTGVANSGDGGQGTTGAGHSGVVIVRVKV